MWRGDKKSGMQLLQEALALTRQLNSQRGLIYRLLNLGCLCCAVGSYTQAESHYREALAIAYPNGATGLTAQVILRFGELAQAQGQPGEALQHYRQSLTLVKDLNHRVFVGKCLSVMATLGGVQDLPWTRHKRCGCKGRQMPSRAAHSFRQTSMMPLTSPTVAASSTTCSLIRPWPTAWAEGQAMPLNAAIAYALSF